MYIDKYGDISESNDIERNQYNNYEEETGTIYQNPVREYNWNAQCDVRKDSSSRTNEDQEFDQISDSLPPRTCSSRGCSHDSECDIETNEIRQEKEGQGGDPDQNKENETTNTES